ncbi:MAG: hypothetical protein MSH24_01355 [Lachnospiraceae bacterium]|nr:hypothetical protein [Lachnospiraceae bacterium]
MKNLIKQLVVAAGLSAFLIVTQILHLKGLPFTIMRGAAFAGLLFLLFISFSFKGLLESIWKRIPSI